MHLEAERAAAGRPCKMYYPNRSNQERTYEPTGDVMTRTHTLLAATLAGSLVTATGLSTGTHLSAQGRGAAPPLESGVKVRSYVFAPTNEKLEYALFVPRKVDKKKPATGRTGWWTRPTRAMMAIDASGSA